MPKPSNAKIADLLEQIADALEEQDESNPFRVRAYREAASEISSHQKSIANFIHEDRFEDLKALPKIGDGIAAVIGEFVSSGQSSLLQNLQAQSDPVGILQRVPGIGEELARRIVKQLEIKSLPELETAAHDGRLAEVEGFGERRVEGAKAALAGMLNRSAQRSAQKKSKDSLPSVELLLDIDREYRQRAKKDDLHKIAPRRFNPDNEAWLPVMHTKRDGWLFTVLFSNTAQAHELDKTNDWVVIYYEKDGKEQQNTIVTETQGELKGKRVVRGRSAENQEYYRAKTS